MAVKNENKIQVLLNERTIVFTHVQLKILASRLVQ